MIRKALIPIAGLGTRMGPLARAVPKAMFPLVTARDGARPVVHRLVSEALTAGIERIALIVSPAHADMVRGYFAAADEADGSALGERIECIAQPAPEGFGEAVARGRDFVDGEPFLLFLGDYVYTGPAGGPSCAAQVSSAFDERAGAAMVGVQAIPVDELCRCGVCRGEFLGGNVYRCTDLIEKPDPETARQRLATPGLPAGRFLAHFGIYAFSPALFDCLDERMAAGRSDGDEIQLTDAQALLLERHPEDYHLLRVEGTAYDAGTPNGYAAAQAALFTS